MNKEQTVDEVLQKLEELAKRIPCTDGIVIQTLIEAYYIGKRAGVLACHQVFIQSLGSNARKYGKSTLES